MLQKLAVVVALLVIASPLALGWGMRGSYEPDTPQDRTGTWMFLTPDTSPSTAANLVYFNGYAAPSGGAGVGTGALGTNPNLATLRTGIDMGGPSQFRAMLGVWKDCNADGYVGLGDQGQLEYRSELLSLTSGTTICPAQSTPIDTNTGLPPRGWFPSHNDGTWVKEFIAIGWEDWNNGATIQRNPWAIYDNTARVWADYGAPGADPQANRPSLDCNIGGAPRGTFATTGGMLWYVDCVDGYHVTDTFDVAVAAVGLQQYSFADHPRDQYQSTSQLNGPSPWGQQGDASYVHAWDCSQPQLASQDVSNDPLGNGGWLMYVNVSTPRAPPGVSTTGSVAGTLNDTGSGLDGCAREQTHTDDASFWGERWHPGSRAANAPYWALERDGARVNHAKQEPSDTLQGWYQKRRPSTDAPALGQSAPPCATDVTNDCGTYLLSSDGSWGSSFDASTRYSIPQIDSNGAPAGAERVSFYAFISPTLASRYNLQLPSGSASGVYGSEACGAHLTGVHNGWDCDAHHWWTDANGNDVEPRAAELGPQPGNPATCTESPNYVVDGCMTFSARVGSPFNLRDVDCYDTSVGPARDLGVSWGTLTGNVCA